MALDCADPEALAAFYHAIVGGAIKRPHVGWVELQPRNGPTLAFQEAPDHQAPTWPEGPVPQQAHLDFVVDDLDAAEPLVLEVGARKAKVQPFPEEFRVFLDPAGHPFCLVLPTHE